MTDSNHSIYASARELQSEYRSGNVTARDVAQAHLGRIRKIDELTNAYLTVLDEDDVLSQAESADDRIRSGDASPLTGIPFLIKDNISTEGVRTTAGSRILDGYVPPFDATVVTRLERTLVQFSSAKAT